MPSYQTSVSSLHSPSPADVSSASILKSVREQEAQFERLARELEAERHTVSHSAEQEAVAVRVQSNPFVPFPDKEWTQRPVGPASHSPSMNSLSSHDESAYPWSSPHTHPPSFNQGGPDGEGDTSKMSTNLLDSCLRELEDRGTLNTGYDREEGNMDYMQPDYGHSGDYSYSPQMNSYGGGGGGGYGNTSFDRHSDHGSHASLSGARHTPRIDDRSGSGGFDPYLSQHDDVRGSPLPRSASPPAHYHEREPPYHNLPPYREAPSPSGLGPRDPVPHSSYPHPDDSFGPRDDYPGSRNSYNTPGEVYRGQPYQDNYSDQPYSSGQYRGSPTGDPYNAAPPGGGYGNYMDDRDLPPQQMYNGDPYSDRHNDSMPPRHDDSFQGQRPWGGDQPSYEQDRYSDAPGQRGSYDQEPRQRGSYDQEPRQRGSYNQEPRQRGSYDQELAAPRYRGSYDQEGRQGQYAGPPPEDQIPPGYRDSYDRGPADNYGGPPPDEDAPRYRGSYQDAPDMGRDPGMTDDQGRRYEGLPPVQSDPFADDPFREQRSHDGSFSHLRDENMYNRGPSPYNRGPSPSGGSDFYDRDRYYDPRTVDYDPQQYNGDDSYPPDGIVPRYDDYPDSRPYHPDDMEMAQRMEAMNLGAPPMDDRRTPSIDGRPPVGGYFRSPDLQEVIDYLSHPDDSVKANAAAYLQHLAYNDDGIKAKTRGLDGIRPLILLLNHDLTEVHKNACGALQNLSFGKANDDNKRAIKNEGGIPELIRLLRKTGQEDVMDSVTGILWNLSSCEDLKQAILEDGLTVLVNTVVLPYSGWSSITSQPSQLPWTTVFRNTTGILRNISSAGYDARKKLRECRGLVNALIHTLQMAHDEIINCKPVENVICTLRNLSYRIQEMEDPDFYKKRSLPRNTAPPSKGESAGCFGGSNKKTPKKSSVKENAPQMSPPNLPTSSSEYRPLWGNDLMLLYLNVLKTCTNPVSVEAAAGAIQNLTACDWAPAVECRAFIRKSKGLPTLVDLLGNESHRVVCAAATALRNLTIDKTNKELIGKYAIQQLVAWLPKDIRHSANKSPDDLTCAVLATLYEVIRSNQDYAVSLIQEDGLSRLKYINTSEGKFLARTLKINHTILKTLWGFKPLHPQYTRMGFTEQDFTVSKAKPRPDSYRDDSKSGLPSSNHTTPYNTLSRPISAQGYDDNTLSAGRMPSRADYHRGNYGQQYGGSQTDMDGYLSMNRSNPALYEQRDRGDYSQERIPPDSIPMDYMGPGYAPLDEPRPHKKPVGGVPLFPNLAPGAGEPEHHPSQQDLSAIPEPLYAQVKKDRRRNDDYARSNGGMIDVPGGQAGADSWV